MNQSKNIDFYTTGKQPAQQDFLRISEWIRANKKKENKRSSASKRKYSSKILAAAKDFK